MATSEGAVKAWETRRGGTPAEKETPKAQHEILADRAHALSHATAAGPTDETSGGHAEHAQTHRDASSAHRAAATAYIKAAMDEKDPNKSNDLLGEHARHAGAAIEHEKHARDADHRAEVVGAHEGMEKAAHGGMAEFVKKHSGEGDEHGKGGGETEHEVHVKGGEKGEHGKGGGKEHGGKEHGEGGEHAEGIAEWLKEKLEEGREAVHEAVRAPLEYEPLKTLGKGR